MSRVIEKVGKSTIEVTKNTATVVTRVGEGAGKVAVSVVNHAAGAGRVMVKAGAKVISSVLLGK